MGQCSQRALGQGPLQQDNSQRAMGPGATATGQCKQRTVAIGTGATAISDQDQVPLQTEQAVKSHWKEPGRVRAWEILGVSPWMRVCPTWSQQSLGAVQEASVT